MIKFKSANVLLTGPPRSGTTMTCSLLNKLPNCVALFEPLPVMELAKLKPSRLLGTIKQFTEEQRRMILSEGKATSNSLQGRVPTNSRADPDERGERRELLDGREIEVANVTGANFSLFIKHPVFFTAALPVLTEAFDCFAVIRNPLSTLMSWQGSEFPVAEGRMPAAEAYDAQLKAALNAEKDTLQRQFRLIDYCFGRYLQYLPGRVVKYEDIVGSGGKALSILHPSGEQLAEPLESRNKFFLKRNPAASEIAKQLLDRDSPCWKFYSRAAVEGLIQL
jgi:hypothetical protein